MNGTKILKRLEAAEQKAAQGTGGLIVVKDWTDEELRMIEAATGRNFSGKSDRIDVINICRVGPGDPLEALPRAARPLEELLKLWEQAENKNR